MIHKRCDSTERTQHVLENAAFLITEQILFNPGAPLRNHRKQHGPHFSKVGSYHTIMRVNPSLLDKIRNLDEDSFVKVPAERTVHFVLTNHRVSPLPQQALAW